MKINYEICNVPKSPLIPFCLKPNQFWTGKKEHTKNINGNVSRWSDCQEAKVVERKGEGEPSVHVFNQIWDSHFLKFNWENSSFNSKHNWAQMNILIENENDVQNSQ